ISDGGHNLSFPAADTSCPAGFGSGDPKLGPLQNNGGPTKTQALGSGSAAIDGVPTIAASCPATDQRGVSRPQGGQCDIGAFAARPPHVSLSTGALSFGNQRVGSTSSPQNVTVTNTGEQDLHV